MSMQALIVGVVIGFIHLYASRALRGSSMPVDAVVYTTVLTLVIFLLFRIPFIWQGVDFIKGDTKSNLPAGGTAAVMLGIMTLTIQHMMASTHTWGGVNYADVFNTSMTVIGLGLLLMGSGIFAVMVRGTGGRLAVEQRLHNHADSSA
jgi:hypothetical protein